MARMTFTPDTLIYDLIIRTQAEFDSMIASSDWLGAKSVCFVGDGGVLRFQKLTMPGIKVPNTVYTLRGINNAIIEVSNFMVGTPTTFAAMFYNPVVTKSEYSIENITLYCYSPAERAFGFRGFANLNNCVVNCFGRSAGIGFESCIKCTNCSASVANYSVAQSFSIQARGFNCCTDLTNCNSSSSLQQSFGQCNSYTDCQGLTNCKGTVNSDQSGTGTLNADVFLNCSSLTNCRGELVIINRARVNADVFLNCSSLTNCEGTGTLEYGSGVAGDTLILIIFLQCTSLSNCIEGGTISAGNNVSSGMSGFANCKYMNSCKQEDYSHGAFLGGTNLCVDSATVKAVAN